MILVGRWTSAQQVHILEMAQEKLHICFSIYNMVFFDIGCNDS